MSCDDDHFLVNPVWLGTQVLWDGVLVCILHESLTVLFLKVDVDGSARQWCRVDRGPCTLVRLVCSVSGKCIASCCLAVWWQLSRVVFVLFCCACKKILASCCCLALYLCLCSSVVFSPVGKPIFTVFQLFLQLQLTGFFLYAFLVWGHQPLSKSTRSHLNYIVQIQIRSLSILLHICTCIHCVYIYVFNSARMRTLSHMCSTAHAYFAQSVLQQTDRDQTSTSSKLLALLWGSFRLAPMIVVETLQQLPS